MQSDSNTIQLDVDSKEFIKNSKFLLQIPLLFVMFIIISINGFVMKKSIISFISLFVILSGYAISENSFTMLPFPIDGVHFVSNGENNSIYLGESGMSFVVNRQLQGEESISKLKNTPGTYEVHRINLSFANANKSTISAKKLTHTNDYVIINNKSEELLTTKEVYYTNVYDGIDFKAYFTDYDEFEFDFVVHPNANPEDIQLAIDHQKAIELSTKGKIKLQFEFNSMIIDEPFVFQDLNSERKEINSSFQLINNVLSFHIGEYDKSKTLVIDPITRFMGSYYGNAGADTGYDIAEDNQGNYYLTGYTQSTINIAKDGYQLVIGGLLDGYLAKFDKDNKRVWATYFGGNNDDISYNVTTDFMGNVIIGGKTLSKSNISNPLGHQKVYGGGPSDGWIAKFNSAGILLWATYYGGEEEDQIRDVAVDNSGNVYAVGTTKSDDAIFFNGYQFGRAGGSDAFVVKFNPEGIRLWGTYLGGDLNEQGNGIVVDPNSFVYIVGTTQSSNNINFNGHIPNLAGGADAFVSSFDNSGSIRWSTYYGGSGQDDGTSIALDNQYLYFGGATTSTNGISFNGNQISLAGSSDGFLVKFDFFQNPYWGTYLGGSKSDQINGIYTTGQNVYAIGMTQSTSGINKLGWQQTYGGGMADGMLAIYIPSGNLESCTYYGGSKDDILEGVTFSRKLLIAGYTTSNNNIAQNGFQNTYSAQYDAMFAEMTEADLILNINQNQLCSEKQYTFNINFSGISFAANNEFIVEISNDLGDFVKPKTVGQKTSSSQTDIQITLPELFDFSKNYRFRLKSTNPVYNGRVSRDSVTVYPSARIDNSDAPICVGNSMIFNTQDIPEVNYKWNFQNGNVLVGSQINNKVQWDTPGEFEVTLISENPICSDTATKTVKVKALPTAGFNADTIVCSFASIKYVVTDKKDYEYSWNAEGGTIESTNEGTAIVRWGEPGKASITLIATDTITGCETIVIKNIKLTDTPVAIISGVDSTCSDCTVTVTANGEALSEWRIENGNKAFESNTQLTFKPNPGVDSVIITLIKYTESGKCRDTATKTIYITTSPIANINGEKVVCEFEEYVYTTSTNPEIINTWEIIGGEEVIKTDNSIRVKWSKNGEGKLKLIRKSNDNTYKDSLTINIQILPKPSKPLYKINADICENDSVFISFPIGQNESIVIDIEGDEVVNGSIYIPKKAGINLVNYIVENSIGCEYKDSLIINVNEAPEASALSIAGNIISSDKDGLHHWYLNGFLVNNQSANQIIATEEGKYSNKYFLNGCWSFMSNEIVYSTSNVEELSTMGINIFPNPADDIIQIRSGLLIKELYIVDVLGKTVRSANNIFTADVDISSLNSGIYFVKIKVNDKLLTQKIIVK